MRESDVDLLRSLSSKEFRLKGIIMVSVPGVPEEREPHELRITAETETKSMTGRVFRLQELPVVLGVCYQMELRALSTEPRDHTISTSLLSPKG